MYIYIPLALFVFVVVVAVVTRSGVPIRALKSLNTILNIIRTH